MRVLCALSVLGLLAACAPSVPDSGAGVGFDNYDRAQSANRDAQLASGSILPPAADVSAAPLSDSRPSAASMTRDADASLEADAMAALQQRNSGVAPVEASPSNPAPQIVSNAAGISEENDFGAVSEERSIQADAQLRAQNMAQYQQVQPTAIAPRPSGGVNIVDYALRTTNSVGQSLYSRGAFSSKSKEARNCRAYGHADLAQEAFLAAGGPERDREGLDADGDGFACSWSPEPFRAIRR